MRRKKKPDIHIVESHEDETDALIDEVLKELREEDGVQEEIDEQDVSIGRVRRQRGLSQQFDHRRSCSNGTGDQSENLYDIQSQYDL